MSSITKDTKDNEETKESTVKAVDLLKSHSDDAAAIRHVKKRDGLIAKFDKKKIIRRLERLLKDMKAFYASWREENTFSYVDKEGHEQPTVELIPLVNNACLRMVAHVKKSGSDEPITTAEIDAIVAAQAAEWVQVHSDYSLFSGALELENMRAQTEYHPLRLNKMSNLADYLYNFVHPLSGERSELVSKRMYNLMKKHGNWCDENIVQNRDYLFDSRAVSKLKGQYLFGDWVLDDKGLPKFRTIGTPQQKIMALCLFIFGDKRSLVKELYDVISVKMATPGSPGWFNGCSARPQWSSCFGIDGSQEDSLVQGRCHIDLVRQLMGISQCAGGIGTSSSRIRSKGSFIAGTSGRSNGLKPWLLVQQQIVARYVDQGGGKRKGAQAVYVETWHGDFMECVEALLPQGNGSRLDDMYIGCWVPGFFWEELERSFHTDEPVMWQFYDPATTKIKHKGQEINLDSLTGDDFKRQYCYLRTKKRTIRTSNGSLKKIPMFVKEVNIQDVARLMVRASFEAGRLYVCAKDHAQKSNQMNAGKIRQSNLCTEIFEISNIKETFVCNLFSINDHAFYNSQTGKFDFDDYERVVKLVVRAMNKIIDLNYYPVPEAEYSNRRHRPLGIGRQGFQSLLLDMEVPFESAQARKINLDIQETLYMSFVEGSCDEYDRRGYTYETFAGGDYQKPDGKYKEVFDEFGRPLKDSPVKQGILQFDMWKDGLEFQRSELDLGDKKVPVDPKFPGVHSFRYPPARVDRIRKRAQKGMVNSLGIALMPTVSQSAIMGETPSFEPLRQAVVVQKTLNNSVITIPRAIFKSLVRRGLYKQEFRKNSHGRVEPVCHLMERLTRKHNGEIKFCEGIPEEMKEIYKSEYDMDRMNLACFHADIGRFTCQSLSLNLRWDLRTPDDEKTDEFISKQSVNLVRYWIFAHKLGLKTLQYYCHTRSDKQKLNLDYEEPTYVGKQIKKRGKRFYACGSDESNAKTCVMCE